MSPRYRLRPLVRDRMTPAQREVVDQLAASPRGGIVGPYDAWLRQPDLAAVALRMGDYCRFTSGLPRDLAELVILIAGRYWDAPFEFSAHAPLARQAGLPDDVIEALRIGEVPSFGDQRAKVVYDVVSGWYADHEIGDQLYEQARRLLGEAHLVDVVAIAGFYAMVCMTLNVFRVPIPDGVADPFTRP